MSSTTLARRFPRLPVVGLDRSLHRLGKNRHYTRPCGGDNGGAATSTGAPAGAGIDAGGGLGNLLLLRCDVVDFWLGAAEGPVASGEWAVALHALLYPNPYPKAGQFKLRWHGHPVFPYLLQVSVWGACFSVRAHDFTPMASPDYPVIRLTTFAARVRAATTRLGFCQLDAGAVLLRASWRTYLDEFATAVIAAARASAHPTASPAASPEAAPPAAALATGAPSVSESRRRCLRSVADRYCSAAAAGPVRLSTRCQGETSQFIIPSTAETAMAAAAATMTAAVPRGAVLPCGAASAFEAKYAAAGQPCFELLLGDRDVRGL